MSIINFDIKRISPWLCFIFFLLTYGFTARGDLQVSDEIAVFSSGINLATNGSLDIESLRWLQAREHIGKNGRNEQLYTKYFPGNVFGTALAYKLGARDNDQPYVFWYDTNPHTLAASNTGARLALRWNALLGALGVTALYAILLRRFDWKTAIATTLLFGLCTDWWYQARGLFSETGAGALLILSLYFADSASPALSGLALGASLLFRPTNLLGLPVWAYGVWKKGIRSAWTVVLIGLGLGMLALYNWMRFASFTDFGYVEGYWDNWIVRGLVGVLLSPGRSPIFYSPILILCLSGIALAYRRDRLFTSLVLLNILGYIFMAALWRNWEGGASWGSRMLIPALPMLALLLAPFIEQSLNVPTRKAIIAIALLTVLGFGIQLLTLSIDPLRVLVFYVETGEVVYGETITSFHNSWLALQIRYLAHFNICNVDAYSIRQLFAACQ